MLWYWLRFFFVISVTSKHICSKFQYNYIQTQIRFKYCGRSIYDFKYRLMLYTQDLGIWLYINYISIKKILLSSLPKVWDCVLTLWKAPWHSSLAFRCRCAPAGKGEDKLVKCLWYCISSIRNPHFLFLIFPEKQLTFNGHLIWCFFSPQPLQAIHPLILWKVALKSQCFRSIPLRNQWDLLIECR